MTPNSNSEAKIWVSQLNRMPGTRWDVRSQEPVHFYDTTLRDGEQTVGVVLHPDQKLRIAHKLDMLGISRIEAGFPRVSGEDAEAFRQILQAGLNAEIWGFSRAVRADLEELARLGTRATIIEVPSSDIKLGAYGIDPAESIRRAVDAIRFAKSEGMTVAFFPVDGTRARLDHLENLYRAALAEGADELVVVDTIGACGPEAVEFLVRRVREWAGAETPIHFHGHNDFGLATACAIAAVKAGASWVQGTINGMGERAGNADLGEIALALNCLYSMPVALDLLRIREVSAFVRQASGYELAPWKPVVGGNLFVRESGAVASQFHIPEAIEPFSADLVGAKRGIVLGKKSGLDSIAIKSGELGLDVPEKKRPAVLAEVKKWSIEKSGLLTDDEFRTIVTRLCAS